MFSFLRSKFSGTMQRSLLQVATVVMVPLLALQGLIYHSWATARQNEERQANTEYARVLSALFGQYVGDIRRQAGAIGENLLAMPQQDVAHANATLTRGVGDCRAVLAWHYATADGRIIASSVPETIGTSVGDHDYYRQIVASGRDWSISNVIPGTRTGKPVIVVAQSVRDDGGLRGIVLAIVAPGDLRDLPLAGLQRKEGGTYSIFDAKGNTVFRSVGDVGEPAGRWLGECSLLKQAYAKGDADGAGSCPPEVGERIDARVAIPELGWAAAASLPLSIAMRPVFRGLYWAVLLNAATLALTLVGVTVMSHRLSRPLEQLRRHARDIGEGKLDSRIIVHDIKELNELAESLNVMAAQLGQHKLRAEQVVEELRRSNEELEQFAYVASHDLQEPLRIITGYVQLLQRRYKDRLDKDADDFIGFTVESVDRMRQLISDLLAYSRVGTRGVPFAAVDMGKVFGQAKANLAKSIAESDAQVVSDDLPAVLGDQGQLVQLFQNLIGNAIKFRGQGRPEIHVSARRSDALWQFSVSDNGIGIDPAYFEKIFVIFQRLHTQRQYPGTGIGLSICKKTVDRHGGTIWLESAPGSGTTFHFTLSPAEKA